MNVDYLTLLQLGVFDEKESYNCLFRKLDFTISSEGRFLLRQRFLQPCESLEEIEEVQKTLATIGSKVEGWSGEINNGVIFVIEQYLQNRVNFNSDGAWHQAMFLPLIYKADFDSIKFAMEKTQIFLRQMIGLHDQWKDAEIPGLWNEQMNELGSLLENFPILTSYANIKNLSNRKVLAMDKQLGKNYKSVLERMLSVFYHMDMFFSLAQIQFLPNYNVVNWKKKKSLNIQGFYHPLLQEAEPYSVAATDEKNFLFLTGANMSGKSTFIRSVGIVVYLAHLGIAVPAQSIELSFMDGLSCSITNTDNILEGESYFYSEVQRINDIINRIEKDESWLVLMDELFKGTNYKDALRCSEDIVKGLVKYEKSFFVLTTHLYELANTLQGLSQISYKYFETTYSEDGQYHFTYNILDGVSDDTIGYKILENSGVLAKLDAI